MKKMTYYITVLVLLFTAIATSTSLLQTVQAQTTTIFYDGFERDNFSAWSGVMRYHWCCTAYCTGGMHYSGSYSARFSTGMGMMMGMMYPFQVSGYSAVYKNIAATSDVYVSGDFSISRSGLVTDTSSFSLILLRASGNDVAYAGWRRIGGVVRWFLVIRSGTGVVTAYSTISPSLYRWYHLDLHWRNGVTTGLGELRVNGVRVAFMSGRNTAAFGNVNQVRVGLPKALNSATTTVYADNSRIFRQ